MFTQEALVFIWVAGVLVNSYESRSKKRVFYAYANTFVQALFQHPSVKENKCRIVFVTAKPMNKIIPIMRSLINHTNVSILAREDIISGKRMFTPRDWIRIFNLAHDTAFTEQNTWIIDSNYINDSKAYMPYGRMAGMKFAAHTLLLKPQMKDWWVYTGNANWHADNLRDMTNIVVGYFDAIYKYNELPLSVFTCLRNVLDEVPAL